jgi:hypothetical protein
MHTCTSLPRPWAPPPLHPSTPPRPLGFLARPPPLPPLQIYTIWNFRREALQPIFEAGGEEAQRASDGELQLTHLCLTENPKSYSAWHHRKWVVQKGLGNLDHELQLVSR